MTKPIENPCNIVQTPEKIVCYKCGGEAKYERIHPICGRCLDAILKRKEVFDAISKEKPTT